jgi:hypothetical protein
MTPELQASLDALRTQTEAVKAWTDAILKARSRSCSFTDDRAEFERERADGKTVIYTAALHLPQAVHSLSEGLRSLAQHANSVNVLRPIRAYRRLAAVRENLDRLSPQYHAQLAHCQKRLAEPVEGASEIDFGFIQGVTTAIGTSALFELTNAYSSGSEALDRKSAYAMACFSLYIALISLVLGVVSLIFGWA